MGIHSIILEIFCKFEFFQNKKLVVVMVGERQRYLVSSPEEKVAEWESRIKIDKFSYLQA